ncbi:TPA: hypothetical protein PTV74_003139 [Clostridium botulinum]|nr:hypothetical protein [Clostridium botulinum]EKS4395692.1 hypothetical protein [Clostridium botulinum]HDK7194832.1 hypothetical protein [Clostridium botulinum]HDK7206294.1 hypothetical protein [Clostridium botulinum]HDK7210030.1 hypothetical protein [Clostridium botulinum]
MSKISMMGSSKYEFEPNKFNEDIQKHRENHKRKEESAMQILEEIINQDTWQEDNFRTITKCLRELKTKYNL